MEEYIQKEISSCSLNEGDQLEKLNILLRSYANGRNVLNENMMKQIIKIVRRRNGGWKMREKEESKQKMLAFC